MSKDQNYIENFPLVSFVTPSFNTLKYIKDTISSIKPDVIINCIGILIKGSKVNPANPIFINSYFPHLLVAIADGSIQVFSLSVLHPQILIAEISNIIVFFMKLLFS